MCRPIFKYYKNLREKGELEEKNKGSFIVSPLLLVYASQVLSFLSTSFLVQ
jgi:hypothetical protein